MRYVSPAKFVALSILSSTAMFGQLTITNYQLVSQQAESATTTYTYSAQVVNTGVAVGSVTATATGENPFAFRLEPAADTLNFGPVPANGTATSTNTFSIIVTNGGSGPIVFSSSTIQWSFTTTPVGPTANAGSNQTVQVGSTATLNGSGSTNPSGAGTLSYQWVFLSRPTGSLTVIFNPQGVNPTFLVDVKGTYVIQLTVGNGSGQTSTATVTVTTGTVAPVANAGPNRSADIGATVTLNGSGSSDSNGNKLTYLWTLPVVPGGSQASLTGATTVQPTFVPDLQGIYAATLVVNDGTLNSNPSTVTITTGTVVPVANAGPNQTLIPIGSKVQLNGSASSDADGDALTYSWSLPTLPANSNAALSSTTVVNPTFTADRPGTYVPQLIVDDGSVPSNPSTVTITTSAPQPPVANAGLSQTVKPNTVVSLNGSGSTDPQNFQLTYSWSLIHTPANSQATLIGATTATPTFLADVQGIYVAQLVVNDGYLSSNPALAGSTVTISSSIGQPPSANAGPAQSVSTGATVTLNGSGSTDPQSATPLTYSWTMTSKPSGSGASLTNPNTVSPTFVADVAGAYVAQLVVTNTLGLSSVPSNAGSTVMITAASTPSIILQSGVTVNVGGQSTVNLSLSSAPTSGSVFVSLNSSNLNAVTLPTSTVVLSSTAPVAVKVNGVGFGSSTITATAGGYVTGTTTVVSTDTASFSPNTMTITGEVMQQAFLFLSSPAATPITLSLSSSNPSIATVPATVTINANSSNVNVPVTGVSGGTATITASSTAPSIAATTLKVTVNAVEITTTQLNNANWNVPYSEQLTASGGTQGYTWSLAPGSTPLPTGMSVSPSGVLGGTPMPPNGNEQTQTLSVTFRVADSSVPQQTATATLSLLVLAGIPAKIAPVTGTTPQQTADTTAFPTPLAVTVTDKNSFVVPNASVTFTIVPGASGASGTFAGSTPGSATVTTNLSGIATAPALTANNTLGGFTVTASVAVTAPNIPPDPVTFNLTNVFGVPKTIAMTSGSPQTAMEGTPFTNPLVVTVEDAGGNPVPSATVTFTITPQATSGATGTFAGGTATATTGSNGVATSVQFTAGSKVGQYTVNAASGAVTTGATFSFTNTVGPAFAIAMTSGSGQQAAAGLPTGAAFAQPLVATVTDSGGNPVPGNSVTFTAAAGAQGQSATFAPNPATTGSNGAVSVTATANSKASPSSYTVTAAAAGVSLAASFTLTNIPGPAATIVVNGGTSPQTVNDGAAFTPLVVLVSDSGGNPVNNQTVTFTIVPNSTSSASASFAGGVNTAVTNASGLATSKVLTANNNVGAFSVTANTTPQNVPAAAVFSLTNQVGPATSIAPNGTLPASVQINQAFTTLVAKVLDQGGNLVTTPVSVTFTAPTSGSGASGTFANGTNTTTVTTVNGLATATTFTANGTAGTYNVQAFVPSSSPLITTNFALTNLVGPVASLAVNGLSTETTPIGTPFGSALSVVAKDAGGNLVPNVGITFSAPGTGASAGFPTLNTTTATTGTAGATIGIATSSIPTANGVAGGPYPVTAAVTATPAISTSFSLTNIPGPPSSIVPNFTTQSTVIATAFPTLQVTVKDSAGDLLQGISVTFMASAANGASGTFGASGASTTVQTNSVGVASATLTANTKAGGPYVVTASIASPALSTSFSLTNTPSTPTIVQATSGSGNSVTINGTFPALVATVLDGSGNPVPNVGVTFTAPGGTGATGLFGSSATATATTGASGTATATLTANSKAGPFVVTVALTATPSVSSTFSLTNNPGPANTITILSGNPQSVPITMAYAPLSVTVTDTGGNPVAAGTPVTFAPVAGASGASATFGGSANATTNSSGVATTQSVLTANTTKGIFTVSVTSGSVTITGTNGFQLTSVSGPPTLITLGTTPSAVAVTSAFGAMTATVTDAGGNLVANTVQVTFSAPAATGTNATGTFATSATVNTINGVATAPAFTAGTVAGSYQVTVTATTGTATPKTFSLTNNPGPPATIAVSGGTSGQSATVNIGGATTSTFGALAVTVQDAQGNLLGAGTPVTFKAPTGTGIATGLFGTNTSIIESTNASGVATVPAGTLIAGTVAGTFNLTVTAGTNATLQQFPLTNGTAPVASIAVSSGASQQAQLGTAFGNPLIAVVTDANGNLINGATVIFTAPPSGPTGTFANGTGTTTVLTGANGLATSTAYTPSTSTGIGSDIVTAKVGNFSTTFSLTNLAAPPAKITVVSSTNTQSVTVGQPFANPLAVTVTDAYGNPYTGATVTFTPPATGATGTFPQNINIATTNSSGLATSNVYTANTVSGANTVTVSVSPGSGSATFTLTNTPGAAYKIVPTSGGGQIKINTQFMLAATVEDQYSNVVTSPASVISFTPTAGTNGASTTGSGAAFTSNGVATANLTTNLKLGAYTVTAQVSSGTPLIAATYSITNLVGNPTSIVIASGNLQTAAVTQQYSAPLVVTVTDAGSNPVPGVSVNFTASGSGTGNFSLPNPATTNPSGQAQVTFTATTVAGTVSVQATTVTTPALNLGSNTFALTNTHGPVAKITAQGVTSEPAYPGTEFPNLLQALVQDQFNNAISGAAVTFNGPTSGNAKPVFGDDPSGNTSSAVTNSSGIATSLPITAGQFPGSYPVTATVGTVTGASYTLTNSVAANPPAAALSMTAANGGSLTLGQNMMMEVQFNLSTAPTSPVTVTVTTDGVNLLLGQNTGVQSEQAVFTTGQSSIDLYVQAQGTLGSFPITIDAPGYTSATGTINVVPSGFILASALDTVPPVITSISSYVGVPSTLEVVAVQLNSLDNFVSPYTVGTIRGGLTAPISVPISVTGGVGTVPASVTFASGTQVATVNFTATNTGAGTIRLGTMAPGSGFNTPTVYQSLGVTVAAAAISPQSVTIGNNLETALQFTLDGVASNCGTSGYELFTVSTTSGVLLFANTATAGVGVASNSIQVPVVCGQSSSQPFYAQVVGGTVNQTISYTVNGTGFPMNTGTVTVGPSGFAVAANGTSPFSGQFFRSVVGGQAQGLEVFSYLLDGSGNLIAQQLVASTYASPGVTISMGNDNPTAGALSSPTVTIAPGTGIGTNAFNASMGGTSSSPLIANISIAKPGGFTAANPADTTIQAQIVNQSFSLQNGGTVGQFLQTYGSVGVASAVQGTALVVQVQVPNGSPLLLSTTGTDDGSQIIYLTIPVGSLSTPNFAIYGLGSSGTATYTVSQYSGGTVTYNSNQVTINLAPSGVALLGSEPFGSGQALETSVTDASPIGQPPFTVAVGILGGSDGTTFNTANEQAVMGGSLAPTITAILNLNGAGTLGATQVTIPPGSPSVQVPYTPPSTIGGNPQITLGAVSGVSASDSNSITVFLEP